MAGDRLLVQQERQIWCAFHPLYMHNFKGSERTESCIVMMMMIIIIIIVVVVVVIIIIIIIISGRSSSSRSSMITFQ